MGPIYGEGDSLITLLSLVGMPPQKMYIFLGCYFGLGFGKSLDCQHSYSNDVLLPL